MRRLRLGIDMDFTAFDVHPAWRASFNASQGICHSAPYPEEFTTWETPRELCKRCMVHCCVDPVILSQGIPQPGAYDAFQYLAAIADIFIITHRREDLRDGVIELFDKHDMGQYVTEYHVGHTPKLEVARRLRLDALIDDGPANIADLIGTEILPIVFNMPHNQGILKAQRAYGWGDVCRFTMLWRVGALRNVPLPRGM